ncbi:spg1 [Symbiodinium sp. KB8]|nr:spg1 [Symbiodinium sp. KB8]
MVKYVQRRFDSDYNETIGVQFLEKELNAAGTKVIMSLWDLGGAKQFTSMLPMVCVDSVAMLFLFDLTREGTLDSVREWYRQVRALNQTCLPFLVGTKFDEFYESSDDTHKAKMIKKARKFSKAMKAPLAFVSSSHGINVSKLFKLVFFRVLDVPCTISEKTDDSEPILEYVKVSAASETAEPKEAGGAAE